MMKPVSSRASFAFARRISGSPVTAARRARSTRLGPGHEAQDGLELAGRLGRDEHERLDDLAELGTDGRSGLVGGVGRIRETSGRRGPRPCARRRRRPAGSAGARALGARPEYTRAVPRNADRDGVRSRSWYLADEGPEPTGPGTRSSWLTATCRRGACSTALAGLGCGGRPGRRGGRRPRSRRGARRAAGRPGRRPGLARRHEPRARRGPDLPILRAPVDKDESDAELALLAGRPPRRRPGHRARRVRRPAPRPRARQPVAARPSRPRGHRDRAAGRRCPGVPGGRAGPRWRTRHAQAARAPGRDDLAVPVRRRCARGHDPRPPVPSRRRGRCARARPAGCRTSAWPPTPR